MPTIPRPSPFDNLKVTRENRRNSLTWFQSQIQILRRASYQPKALMSSTRHLISNPTPGKQYCFLYDAKYKDELPYWDKVPVIFFIERKDAEHFFGLNVHYLPPDLRLRLLMALYDIANNDRFDATTRIRMSYDILMRLSKAKNLKAEAAFKQYLFSHMQSKFLEIPPSAWTMTALLPIEAFQKATKFKVWHDTKNRI